MAQQHSRAPITRRALLARAVQLGAVGILAACSPAGPLPFARTESGARSAPDATSEPKHGGTLRIGTPEDIFLSGFPHLLTPANFHLDNLIYDTLVTYDEHMTPQPGLATRWAWSSDFRQLSIQLRQGVRFHNGRPFTSDDVRFNLERIREPASASQLRNYAELMDIATPAPDRVVISYAAPARSSFDALTLALMANPETLDQARAGRDFVGTGPFRFEEWVPGDHMHVRRNPDYWQPGKPYLDRVEVRVLPDAQAAVIALETGAIDWLVGVQLRTHGDSSETLPTRYCKRPRVTCSTTSDWMSPCPELADKRVRQALGFAMNRQRIVDTAMSGFGRPASIPWPRSSMAYDEALDNTYQLDRTRARDLLSLGGWQSDSVLPITVSNTVPITGKMAEVIQSDLASIGVQSRIQPLGSPDFISRLQRGQFRGAWILGVAWMNMSPPTLFRTAFPVRMPNSSNFVSERYQALIHESYVATDDQQLRQSLGELTRIMLDEAFVQLFAESTSQLTGPEAARTTVRNIIPDRFGQMAYQDVWLDR